MQTKINKTNKALTKTISLTSLLLIIGCSTTKHRDTRLLENLEKQNAVLDAMENDRQSTEVQAELQKSEVLLQAEVRLTKALGAVKSANQTVILKMKPEIKKECEHGQNEGADD